MSNLLVIRGIKPQDIFAERINKKVDDKISVYTRIPHRFTGVRFWPSESNLRCWECDRIPANYPKFIPVNPINTPAGLECDAHGHFDEWNCAVSYIMKNYPREQKCDLLRLVSIFEAEFSGRRKLRIQPSPPKTLMKKYCGETGIGEHEYSAMISALNCDYASPESY